MHRTPQRSYTPQSLEAWFQRLSQDWERFFTHKELSWGRQFYRTGEIRSTELLDGSAIVHFKRGKEPLYVIVDWDGRKPSFRQSHPDFAPGRGLAVAGMYELEEFIADEIPPITEGIEANASEGLDRSKSRLEEVQVPTEKHGRLLRVRLSAKEDGLWMEAGWGPDWESADWTHFSIRELSKWEREQLIGYTARAHRCGFRPGDREGTYRLQDAAGIGKFLSEELLGWKLRYPVTEDASLSKWKTGLKLLQPVISVAASGRESHYSVKFSYGKSVVPEEIRMRVFRQPGHTHFVPGHGIFQVDPMAMGTIHEWKTLLPSAGEGVMPRYLLFTFARDPHVRLNLSREIAAWKRDLEDIAINDNPEELPPYLRTYQNEGVFWLKKLEQAGCHSLLADEMGLGKTLQVLTYLDIRKALGKRNILVVCPASVVPVWEVEIQRFFPDTPVRILSRQDRFGSREPALWISSYTQLRRNKQLLGEISFDYAILDEAQSIKNPDAKVTHACFAIRAEHRIALTGTPVENRPLDLWTLFRFLMPGFLGSRHQFEDQVKHKPEFIGLLRQQVGPFILRRTKLAVASDLPPKVEIDWTCPLTPVQRKFYTELTSSAANELTGKLGDIVRDKRMHLFSLLTRLRQACCDPDLLPGQAEHWTHSGKLQSLVNRLEDAFSGGSKVVVFSQFVKFLRRARNVVKSEFPEIPQLELTGSTVDRSKPVQRFGEIEGPAVFFVSLRAGGTGLNLQAADYVFLLDPWWNPAVEAQAVDRVHRIGQEQRVIVYRLVTKGTIEERIEKLKKEKGQLFDNLLSDLDAPVDLLKQFENLEALIRLEES